VEDAEDSLNILRIAGKKNAGPLLDQAQGLVLQVERLYMLLPHEDKNSWRVRIEELRRDLQMATACAQSVGDGPSSTASPSAPAAPSGIATLPSVLDHREEVVGDIDDLFTGLQINIPGEEEVPGTRPAQQEFPGRRFVKVVRSPVGGCPSVRATTAPPSWGHDKIPVGEDIVGQGEYATGGAVPLEEEREVDEEAARYPPRQLHVELPVFSEVAIAAAAAAAEQYSGASQGSANSTMAQKGAGGRGATAVSESDDDSITSPEDGSTSRGFR